MYPRVVPENGDGLELKLGNLATQVFVREAEVDAGGVDVAMPELLRRASSRPLQFRKLMA